uniref:Uncharacterized protein n=1 Tax=Anguilla anguilla TaxID=7936 RepID=A0A0E9VNV6_ANGAN
MTNDFTKNK